MVLPFKTEFTDETLETAPTEASQLLSAINAVPEIATIMEQAGMGDAQIEEGKKLWWAAVSTPAEDKSKMDTPKAKAARAASAEVNQWDEPNLPVLAAALARHFPGPGEYIFGDVSPSPVATEAIEAVGKVLVRTDHLEKGSDPNRASTAADDKKAVALLAERGFDKAERTRLQGLIEVALGPKSDTAQPATPAPAVDPTARRAALLALKLWVNEWATVGHARIKKRAYLIRMGLAKRKMKKKDPEPTPLL